MSIAPTNNGFLLLDAELNLVASTDSTLQILCFPREANRIKQPKVSLANLIRTTLVDREHPGGPGLVKEFKSGKRRYFCKSFRIASDPNDSLQPAFAVVLERNTPDSHSALTVQFDLTEREAETVQFLLQGLSSKEIAARMNISPNTVKSFLRLVMVKMKVSKRSGIAGKIAGSKIAGSKIAESRTEDSQVDRKSIEGVAVAHLREYVAAS